MNDQRITGKYMIVTIVAVLCTWILHEFTHWLTAELLGHKAIMRINSSSVLEPENLTELQATIISISGPIVTIFQGLIVYLLLKKKTWNKYLYPFLFTAFYMRILAGLMNFINLNDEGRVSAYFDIGTFTLPVLVSGFLFYMVYKISRKHAINWKFQLATNLIVMTISSVLILGDQFFTIRII